MQICNFWKSSNLTLQSNTLCPAFQVFVVSTLQYIIFSSLTFSDWLEGLLLTQKPLPLPALLPGCSMSLDHRRLWQQLSTFLINMCYSLESVLLFMNMSNNKYISSCQYFNNSKYVFIFREDHWTLNMHFYRHCLSIKVW